MSSIPDINFFNSHLGDTNAHISDVGAEGTHAGNFLAAAEPFLYLNFTVGGLF